VHEDAWVNNDLVVQSSDMALMNVASLANSGALDLSPRFQRRNRWDRQRQSRLIESFVINVPVPPVYLAEERRGRFSVIDGKQRLTAIAQFLNDEYRLSGTNITSELDGLRFSELPAAVIGTLNMRPIRAVTVLRQTPDAIKYEVFLRLNTGGEPLNAQEVRNVAFPGLLNDKIIELSEHPFLRRQLKIRSEASPPYADMTDVEYVLRFFAMAKYWRNLGGSMRRALDEFMLRNHDIGISRVEEHTYRFHRAIDACQMIWGDRAFRRYDGRQWRDQMIGGVYDAEMVAIDLVPDEVVSFAIDHRRDVMTGTAALFEDRQFDASVRLSTNTSTRVRLRITRVADLLQNLASK
jgi:hypothetical protein